jgi:aryl-alcohol dehydrogenase-like predicted oxidoreductase
MTPEQVRANAAAGDWRLGPAELDEIDRIVSPPD